MARLVRPLRQRPQLIHITTLAQPYASFIPAFSCNQESSLPWSLINARAGSVTRCFSTIQSEEDDAIDTGGDERKRRKREAKLAVQWGTDPASFSTPQIKRILRIIACWLTG